MINIINFINILQKKKKKENAQKCISPKRKRERERLLIPRINPSSIRLEGKKKAKEERGRIILT